MYRGYNLRGLTPTSFENPDHYIELIEQQYETVKRKVTHVLDVFTRDDGSIDGTRLQEHWFPAITTDVFISHSHNDELLAKTLAGWLFAEFQITSFIDSCVWGYAEKLLKTIDNDHCLNGDKQSYSYERRNRSTSHVYMMLATALGQMIDKSECLIFLSTENSITTKKTIANEETHSPWLLMELGLASIIKRRVPNRTILENFGLKTASRDMPTFRYNLTPALAALNPLGIADLNKWQKTFQEEHGQPLDSLYLITKKEGQQ